MLDSEPDTHDQPTDPAVDAPPAAPPRRRRAASRPAGPPAAVADPMPVNPSGDEALSPGGVAQSGDTSVGDTGMPDAPPPAKRTRKAPTKRAAKAAAGDGPGVADR